MRQPEFPLDPDLAAELEAIDATLAGQIVDPEFAELAELTVMVAAERPQLESHRAQALDDRVLGALGSAAPSTARRPAARRRRVGAWSLGLSAAAAAAVAVVLVAGSSGGSINGRPFLSGAPSSSAGSASSAPAIKTPPASNSSAALNPTPPLAGSSTRRSAANQATPASRSLSSSSSAQQQFSAAPPISSGGTGAPTTPAPVRTARKTIQSAQLQLSAPGRWIDVVAQEVYDVVGQEKGIVRSSQVTASTGNGSFATFDLSIPSSNLSDAVTRLSGLQHARVSSRTDGSVDVNGQYLSLQRRLADARALRASLLKQLAAATTQAQVDSLQARIHDVEAQINSDEAALHRLEYQISFSQLYVTVNQGPVPVPLGVSSGSGHGFTIGQAAHDALHVLTVAAGVALIALAALVPLGLLVALVLWVHLTLRRRRREHALDTA